MGILGDLLTGALVAGKTAIDYNAFIALNALVNQYRYHILTMRHLLGEIKGVEYEPFIWTPGLLSKMSSLMGGEQYFTYLEKTDPILKRPMVQGIAPFPRSGKSAFNGVFGTMFPLSNKLKRQSGGNVANILVGAAEGAVVTGDLVAFMNLGRIWNVYRWYLLEYRFLSSKAPYALKLDSVQQTFMNPTAMKPFGKLLLGLDMYKVVKDPNIQGLENNPPLKHFISPSKGGRSVTRKRGKSKVAGTRKKLKSN